MSIVSFHLELIKEAERIRLSNLKNPKDKIDIYHEAADACRSVGKFDEAIKYFKLELREAQLGDCRDDILFCHRFIGECFLSQNEFSTCEKHFLNFLSASQEFADDERTEQAYTCLAHLYWLWLSYLQEDILHDSNSDLFPREICRRSLDAAKNSLLMIEKLDFQLKIEMKKKVKGADKRQDDLALRRVRSYINIGKISRKYV